MPARSTGVTLTASGCCTSPLTTYSRNSCIAKIKSSRCRRRRCHLAGLLDEAGDGVARLRALADPVLGAIQFQDEIVTLLQRLIRADFLDELAIARTAAVGHYNAEIRGILGPDTLHANFYCHKCFKRTGKLAVRAPVDKRSEERRVGKECRS